ncbi:hypothetical protein ACOZ38_25085 [Sphaerisporangium viridialbum]|uniref:hypothetical protein n=1 Tax=Sphaerisporangium viridialbum TaxID=46189 RepID=UPI003C76D0D5
MHTDKPLHDLGTWPSPAEILQGDYPEWHISREVDGSGRHGDWVAQHATEHDGVHRAPDIPALRTQLEKDAARRRTTRRDGPATRHSTGSRPSS